VKAALDLRLVRGEITEAEYHQLITTVSSAEPSAGMASVRKAFGWVADTYENMNRRKSYNCPAPTNADPVQIKKLVVHGDFFLFRGQKFLMTDVVGLSFFAIDQTTKLTSGARVGTTTQGDLTIRTKGGQLIAVSADANLFSNTYEKLKAAYDHIRARTFEQRLNAYLAALEQPGYIAIDGAKIHKNGKVEKNGTWVSLHSAMQKNTLKIGTSYDTVLFGSGSNPNQIIAGHDGTSLFSTRVKFEIDRDHDILFGLIRHLSEGKAI